MDTSIVELCVGGVKFACSRSTLLAKVRVLGWEETFITKRPLALHKAALDSRGIATQKGGSGVLQKLQLSGQLLKACVITLEAFVLVLRILVLRIPSQRQEMRKPCAFRRNRCSPPCLRTSGGTCSPPTARQIFQTGRQTLTKPLFLLAPVRKQAPSPS